MKKVFGLLVPLILWAPLLFAQVKFTATASKTSVSVGERFEVNFSINANAELFTLPDLSAFEVLYGPNATTHQMVNHGDTTFYTTYSCILVAEKEGTLDIDSVAIVANGQTLYANSLKINVKGQFQPGRQQQFKIPGDFAAEDSSPSAPADSNPLANQIFLRAEADKTHAYVGEQIKVTYKLYTRVAITGSKLEKAPALKGFRIQDVAEPKGQQNPWTTEKCGRHEIRGNHRKTARGFP